MDSDSNIGRNIGLYAVVYLKAFGWCEIYNMRAPCVNIERKSLDLIQDFDVDKFFKVKEGKID